MRWGLGPFTLLTFHVMNWTKLLFNILVTIVFNHVKKIRVYDMDPHARSCFLIWFGNIKVLFPICIPSNEGLMKIRFEEYPTLKHMLNVIWEVLLYCLFHLHYLHINVCIKRCDLRIFMYFLIEWLATIWYSFYQRSVLIYVEN